jgi:hypothetical protein
MQTPLQNSIQTLISAQFKWKLELFWLIFTLILILLVQVPFFGVFYHPKFTYFNILFIVVAVFATRHIFLLKYSPLGLAPAGLKLAIMLLSLPAIFLLIESIQNFTEFLDNEGMLGFQAYFKTRNPNHQSEIISYLRKEYVFTGVAAVISMAFLPIRLLMSIWRVYNKTGKV